MELEPEPEPEPAALPLGVGQAGGSRVKLKSAGKDVIDSWKAAEHARLLQRAADLEKRNGELDAVLRATLEEHRALELRAHELEVQRDSLKKETKRLDQARETATKAVEEANARALKFKESDNAKEYETAMRTVRDLTSDLQRMIGEKKDLLDKVDDSEARVRAEQRLREAAEQVRPCLAACSLRSCDIATLRLACCVLRAACCLRASRESSCGSVANSAALEQERLRTAIEKGDLIGEMEEMQEAATAWTE